MTQTIQKRKFRAVVLTAIKEEFVAVKYHLKNIEEVVYKGTIYHKGIFQTEKIIWEVSIAQIDAGNNGAAAETERAINHFKPKVAMFVGVAGGIKDVKLGDVVAGTKIYGFESGKATDEGFKPRPNVGQSTYAISQRAKYEANKNDWRKRIKPYRSAKPLTPTAHRGPIAAGEEVIASIKSQVYTFIKSNYGDSLAVEMEGRGFLQATNANEGVQALVVRGISDLIEGKQSADAKGSQPIAANHASAFAFEILAKYGDSLVKDVKKPVAKALTKLAPTVRQIAKPKTKSTPIAKPTILPKNFEELEKKVTHQIPQFLTNTPKEMRMLLGINQRLKLFGLPRKLNSHKLIFYYLKMEIFLLKLQI